MRHKGESKNRFKNGKKNARPKYSSLSKEMSKIEGYTPEQERINFFLDNISTIEHEIRNILATREHIPTRKQAKEVRRKKAQGKYFVD